MKPTHHFLFFLNSFLCLFLGAQELPPIQIYSPEMYGAETQNWSISQSKDKHIYIANNKGLLEFNGAQWHLYPSPNGIMRSVNIVDNVIYTGCYREFGYWEKNEYGELTYASISEKLKIPFLEDEEFWNIIALDDWVLFQSLKRIYIYNKINQKYSFIDSQTTIYKMFKVNETIYFQKTKDGLYKIENGESLLVTNNQIIKDNLLVNIFNLQGKLLVETEDNGFYVLDEKNLTKWEVAANETLSNISVYRSIQLRDRSFVLGTRSDGVLHLTEDGKMNHQINTASGLSNNTIHAVFEDSENNIWLGLDNGINCINMNSPFTIYHDKEGKIGSVYASIVFNGNLYLGTNQGLFYRPLYSNNEFQFISGTQGPVRCLVEYEGTLFCGHDVGTFVVNEGNARLIVDVQGTWQIIPIYNDKDKLLQGNYDGLYVIEKEGGDWKLKNKILGFNISSRYFEFLNSNEIFVSHEYKGVYRINVNNDLTKAVSIVKDSSIEKGLNSSLIKYNNNLLYTYKKGVFKYNSEEKAFYKDSILSTMFTESDYTSGKLIYENKRNILWGFSNNDINYVSSSRLINTPKVNKISYSKMLPRGLTGYENITFLRDNKFLLGSSGGYTIIDLNKIKKTTYSVNLNSITKNDINNNLEILDKNTYGDFLNNDNNIKFTYSVAEYDKYLDTQYQYQLKGLYENWSDWSSDSSVNFENLPFGDYTFNVKARVGNDLTSNIESYSFRIQRPFLLSNFMIALYILVVLLFSLMMHNIYKRYYRKQKEKLLEKNKRELALKELENEQQLMRFNNEKLTQDIESKSRELGISTMNLIQKNEFLNSIKNQLKNVTNFDKNLKQAVRMIDKNLNNTDDWQLFEEAFNNADKDFLKIIKAEHPSLTSNDLRLCAYLRLNLSSKEIAPLLNISPRSVEVKRYRLRKKMNLPHESSLTDYILEI